MPASKNALSFHLVKRWSYLLPAFLSLFILLQFESVNGQQNSPSVLASAGGFFQQVNGSLEWTLGELAIDTYAENDLFLTQGFHQGAAFGTLNTFIDDLDFNALVFPNPAYEELFVKIQNPVLLELGLHCFLMDITGRRLEIIVIKSDLTQISIAGVAAGTYILEFWHSKSSKLGSFVIHKI